MPGGGCAGGRLGSSACLSRACDGARLVEAGRLPCPPQPTHVVTGSLATTQEGWGGGRSTAGEEGRHGPGRLWATADATKVPGVSLPGLTAPAFSGGGWRGAPTPSSLSWTTRAGPPTRAALGRPPTAKIWGASHGVPPLSPQVAPVAGWWTDNVAAAATVSAPSAGPRGHASKWHALLPPPPTLPPLSPPSLLPPPQPQRHPVAWDTGRCSASPPPRAGNPTSRGTDGVRTVRHAAARGGP